MKKSQIKIIMIVLLLFILCINNGCLTSFYSAKVAKQGDFHIGLGVLNEDAYLYPLTFYSSIFYRYGLPNNFDIGASFRSTMIVPILTVSGRKQFNFNNRIIDAITVDIGLGGGYFSVFDEFNCYIKSSIIKGNFAFTWGYGKCYRWTMNLFDSNIWYEDDHVFTTRISYEIKIGKICMMPFIYTKAMQEVGYGSLINLILPTDETYSSGRGWQSKYYGLGISIYFDSE